MLPLSARGKYDAKERTVISLLDYRRVGLLIIHVTLLLFINLTLFTVNIFRPNFLFDLAMNNRFLEFNEVCQGSTNHCSPKVLNIINEMIIFFSSQSQIFTELEFYILINGHKKSVLHIDFYFDSVKHILIQNQG